MVQSNIRVSTASGFVCKLSDKDIGRRTNYIATVCVQNILLDLLNNKNNLITC